MAACFLDTSAVVKLYVNESGSLWVHSLLDPAAGNRCYLAAITRVEVVAAISQRARTGSLTLVEATQARRLFRRDCRTRLRSIRLKNAILDRAIVLVANHPLRAYDAVQLASAVSF